MNWIKINFYSAELFKTMNDRRKIEVQIIDKML